MSAYISFTNYDKTNNELTWLNNSTEEKYKAKTQAGVTLDFNINSKFNLLCSLRRKEKNNNNLNCSNFNSCDINKYEYCVDNNVGLICKDGDVYGNYLILFN